jgi:uncharacterized protein
LSLSLVVCTGVHTIIEMVYQWNRDKATANLRKHGIDFADAVSVFSDDLALTIPDERFDEERFVTIGLDGFGRVLVVVYTLRGEAIRVISAREASRQERQQYEEG